MNILTFREWLRKEFDEVEVHRILDHTEKRRSEFEKYVHEQLQRLADALIGGR